MIKANKLKNVSLILAALLLVGCGAQTKEKEIVLETKQETVLENKPVSKKETLEEFTKESKEINTFKEAAKETATKKESKEETFGKTKASEESKGNTKKPEIDGTVRPKESESVDQSKESKKTEEKSASTDSSSDSKPEAKKEKPIEKKSNEAIAKEVLSGLWGSGKDRKNRLESAGYNYSEVQTLVNKMVSAPIVKKKKASTVKKKRVSTSSANSGSLVASMPNDSILIKGVILKVSNNATQASIDRGGRRIVNWGANIIGKKTVGGPSAYFALHNKPYGYLFQGASSFIFKDINGNVKTYNIESRTGIKKWKPRMTNDAYAYVRGVKGDRIAIQTCIDMSGSGRYRIHIFR